MKDDGIKRFRCTACGHEHWCWTFQCPSCKAFALSDLWERISAPAIPAELRRHSEHEDVVDAERSSPADQPTPDAHQLGLFEGVA